tara:strand:+ start:110 stop:607 length:498 start_codon:yes stop_codon:yes gene_type:complete
MFKLLIHKEARPWTPTDREIAMLKRAFDLPNTTLRIIPRRLIPTFHPQTTDPFAYEFRAFTRGPNSYVFVDGTENRHSIAWLMAHELCHVEIGENEFLRDKFDAMTPPNLDPRSDRFHALDPEERVCDERATNLFGTTFDRFWWRNEVKKFQKKNAHRGKWQLHR